MARGFCYVGVSEAISCSYRNWSLLIYEDFLLDYFRGHVIKSVDFFSHSKFFSHIHVGLGACAENLRIVLSYLKLQTPKKEIILVF